MPSVLKTLVATAIAFVCITSGTPLSSVLANVDHTGHLVRNGDHFPHNGHSGGGRGGGGGGGFIANIDDAVDADATVDEAVAVPEVAAPLNPRPLIQPLNGATGFKGRWAKPIDPQTALQFHDKMLARLNERLTAETDPAKQAQLQDKINKVEARKQKIQDHIATNGNAPITPEQMKALHQAAKQSTPVTATAMDAIDAATAELDTAAPAPADPNTPPHPHPHRPGFGPRGPIDPQRALARTDKVLANVNAKIAAATDPTVKASLQAQLTRIQAKRDKIQQHIATNGNAPINPSEMRGNPSTQATAMDAVDAEAEVNDATAEVDEATSAAPPTHRRGFGPSGPIDPQKALAHTEQVIADLNTKIAAATDPTVKAKLENQLTRVQGRRDRIQQHIATNGNAPINPSELRGMGPAHHMGFGPVDPQKALAAHDKMIETLNNQISAETDPHQKQVLQDRLTRCQARKTKIQQLIATNGNKPITREEMRGLMVDSSNGAQAMDALDAEVQVDDATAEVDQAATATPPTHRRGFGPRGPIDPQQALTRTDKVIANINAKIAATTDPAVKAKLQTQLTRMQGRRARIQQHITTNGNAPITPAEMRGANPSTQATAMDAVDAEAEVDDATAEVDEATVDAAAAPATDAAVTPRLIDPQQALARFDRMIANINRRLASATDDAMKQRLQHRLTRIQARKAKMQQYVATHGNKPVPADQMKAIMRPPQQQDAAAQAMDAVDAAELDETTAHPVSSARMGSRSAWRTRRLATLRTELSTLQSKLALASDPTKRNALQSQITTRQQQIDRIEQRTSTAQNPTTNPRPNEVELDEVEVDDAQVSVPVPAVTVADPIAPIPTQPAYTEQELDAVIPTHLHVRVELDE